MDQITWAELETFLQDNLSDPASRGVAASILLDSASQGAKEKVDEFVSRIDGLEIELDYVPTEKQRISTLLSKLRPQLRHTITSYTDQTMAGRRDISLETALGRGSSISSAITAERRGTLPTRVLTWCAGSATRRDIRRLAIVVTPLEASNGDLLQVPTQSPTTDSDNLTETQLHRFVIADLATPTLILGFPWLEDVDPLIS
ncbi:hypothetical protein BDP81DRAFT_450700 [Colletotrichum phormii]|uniref:Uncharacterized protein n=1 Tax=Colletotrichum phormii TaxID=359342 RepID=A0AAI9ZQA0_9PEZI|nr:uncharacterized protein BDP81DRAFT_450700 [Colletotrichum phormii]KAK1635865.1 hypothetical protein BDP81DRAFT_450700 [Colletotrichum phormii]